MGKITQARAYCNGEVGYIAWSVNGPIKDAYGFQITRIFCDTNEDHKKGDRRILPAWVAFEGQKNPNWQEQDTSVWPIQGLFWRDLTLRRSRDSLRVRASGFSVQYEIRAVGPRKAGLPEVPVALKQTYQGKPVPLSYYSGPVLTNDISVTDTYGDVRAAFTNGILSSQWLTRQIDAAIQATMHGKKMSRKDAIIKIINDKDNDVRKYLAGDVLDVLKQPLDLANLNSGSVLMALYELQDAELIEAILGAKSRVHLILSNSSAGNPKANAAQDSDDPGNEKAKKIWDAGNAPARQKLKAAHADIQNRMFNNGHIGHNKFVVLLDESGSADSVMTGSTNWTATGLCGQSNNALIIKDAKVASAYQKAWTDLHKDKLPDPKPLSAPSKNVQGPELRQINMTPAKGKLDGGKTDITIWHSPNTKARTKPTLPKEGAIPDKVIPPDLKEVFALIDDAKQAIFFLVFLPSRQGRGSVVDRAIALGQKNKDLLVVGAVSDPMVLPNYIPPTRVPKGEPKSKIAEPHFYEPEGTYISVVQADALYQGDLVADMEAELKSAGHAIIHDKIVVIDPLSDDCIAVTGSHNLGIKASYENDENLLIIKGNRKLAEAYAVHALDVYDHYKWRARRAQSMAQNNKKDVSQDEGAGRLRLSDSWLAASQKGRPGAQAAYFASGGSK